MLQRYPEPPESTVRRGGRERRRKESRRREEERGRGRWLPPKPELDLEKTLGFPPGNQGREWSGAGAAPPAQPGTAAPARLRGCQTRCWGLRAVGTVPLQNPNVPPNTGLTQPGGTSHPSQELGSKGMESSGGTF